MTRWWPGRAARMKRWAVPGALALSACSAPTPMMDAGFDAGADAGRVDGGVDGGVDAGVDAGYDAGVDAGHEDPCPVSSPGNPQPGAVAVTDAGWRCECQTGDILNTDDGGYVFHECCDTDVGNPCPICCFNNREEDGGRMYYADAGPVCFC